MSMRLPEGLCPALIVFSDRGEQVYANPSVEALTGFASEPGAHLQGWLARMFPFGDDQILVENLLGRLEPAASEGATERFIADFATRSGLRRTGAFQVHAWNEAGRGRHLVFSFLVRESAPCVNPAASQLTLPEIRLAEAVPDALGAITGRVQRLLDGAVACGRPLMAEDRACSGCVISFLGQVERARGLMLGIEEIQRSQAGCEPAAAGPVSPPG